MFEDGDIKRRAEGFLSSITNSFEVVLRRNVKVMITLLQGSLDHKLIIEIPATMGSKSTCSNATVNNSGLDLHQDRSNVSRESFHVKSHQNKATESVSGNASITNVEDCKSDIPFRKTESIIHLRPERNQVLPQDALESTNSLEVDELIQEIMTPKIKDGMAPQKDDDDVMKMDHCSNSFRKNDM